MSERIIALIAGESGTGKSFFCAQFRRALIYDTDIGGGLAYADKRIARNESLRVPVGSYVEILDDLKQRQARRELAGFTTLCIDHVSALQQEANLRHNPRMDRDFGRANDMATREWRKIREFCRNQDFNLICTAHLKAKWEQEKAVGLVADGAKNLEADVGIVLEFRRAGSYPSLAWVKKWRRDPEDDRGQIPPSFPLTLEEFARIAGTGLTEAREPVTLATAEQVTRLETMLALAKLPDGTTEKWLSKAGVDSFGEMPGPTIQKCIDHVAKLLQAAAA